MHHIHRHADIPAHRLGGAYLKDLVYGANDGIITTFAIVAGVAGAGLEPQVVVLLGIASLLADGFSMATSNYLGTKSEHEFTLRERGTEEQEYRELHEEELAEMRGILSKKGYSPQDASALTGLLAKNKEFWLDIKVREELGLENPDGNDSPAKAGVATFAAFVAVGSVPLFPYLFMPNGQDIFLLAVGFTAVVLFVVGVARTRFTGRHWLVAGTEMLFVGGVAASIAYGVGFFVSAFVGV